MGFSVRCTTGLILTVISLIGASASSAPERVLLQGAGSSFVLPLFSQWVSAYNKKFPNIEINYQSVGSGAGIQQLTNKTVDFGATDVPMTEEEEKRAGGNVLHFPVAIGAVAVAYNLPELKSEQKLKLDGDSLALIARGKIKKWNSPEIAKLNPGVNLPDKDIVLVYRSDSSGTTAVFTEYLAAVNAEWKGKSGKTVKWPVGLGSRGNEGVAGTLKNTPWSLGYIELAYALSGGLKIASLKNKSGQFVEPSIESMKEAAKQGLSRVSEKLQASLVDTDGAQSYPIASFTYLIAYPSVPGAKSKELVKFLEWATGEGQKGVADLKYAPLPAPLVTKMRKQFAALSKD